MGESAQTFQGCRSTAPAGPIPLGEATGDASGDAFASVAPQAPWVALRGARWRAGPILARKPKAAPSGISPPGTALKAFPSEAGKPYPPRIMKFTIRVGSRLLGVK